MFHYHKNMDNSYTSCFLFLENQAPYEQEYFLKEIMVKCALYVLI